MLDNLEWKTITLNLYVWDLISNDISPGPLGVNLRIINLIMGISELSGPLPQYNDQNQTGSQWKKCRTLVPKIPANATWSMDMPISKQSCQSYL